MHPSLALLEAVEGHIPYLLQEADTTHEWAATDVSRFLSCKPKLSQEPAVASSSATSTPDPLDAVAVRVERALDKPVLAALVDAFEGSGQLPRDIDRQLLAGARSTIGRNLDPIEKKRIRSLFVAICRTRLNP